MACKYTYGNQVYDSLDDLKAAVKNDLQRSADKEDVGLSAHPVTKIISGAQTGVDMAGLDAGKEIGIPTGGTAAAKFQQSVGEKQKEFKPELANIYGLKEGKVTKRFTQDGRQYDDVYYQRTLDNAQEADGTIWFGNAGSPGGKLTLGKDAQKGKPAPLVNPTSAQEIRNWLNKHNIKTLNVAGNREYTNPGIYDKAKTLLVEALKSNIVDNNNQSNTITTKSDNISYKNNPTNLNTYLNYLGLKDIALNDAIFNAPIDAISKERVFLNTLQQIVENTPVLSAVDISEYVAKDKQKDLPDLKPLAQRIHALSMALSQNPSEKDLREYVKLNTELNAKIIELLTPHIKKVFGKDASIEYKTIRSVDPLYNPSQQLNTTVKPQGIINVYWGQAESATSTKILSNLAPRKFKYKSSDGISREYGSVEHAYQTLKSGSFDQVTYDKYIRAGGYGTKITGKIANKATNLQLMKDLVVASFEQNSDSPAAKKLLQYEKFTHNTNEIIDQAFLEGLKLAQAKLLSSQQSNTTQQPKTEAKITDAEVEAMTDALVEMYPEIELSIESNPNTKAEKVLLNAKFQSNPELVNSEYANYYIAWFRNTPLVQQGIRMYGSEEELVEAIGKQAVVQKGKAWSWWKKFVAWLLNSANDVSDLTKENLRDILTDAFLSRQDLNKQAGTEAGVKLEKNVAVLGGETYLWNNNTGFWQPFTKSEADIEYSNDEMQRRMQEERDEKAQVKNDAVIKPAWKNNSKKALENRLLNTHKAIALHPANAFNLLSPISTNITKTIVERKGISTKKEFDGAIIDPLSNVDASIAMVQGKQGVGIVANAINTKSTLMTVDAKITATYPVQSPLSEDLATLPINLRMLGISKARYLNANGDEYFAYTLGNLVDTQGNSIISNLSESLTQQVDNVNNPVAVELGYTLKTLGLTSYTISLGVPQEVVADLTAKGGIVTAWTNKVEENENLFHKGVTETDVYQNEFGQKETDTTKFEESNSTLKHDFIAKLLRNEKERSALNSGYIKYVDKKGYYLNHDALDNAGIQLDEFQSVKLLFYWELIDQSRAYGNTIKALTADTKTHKRIEDAAEQQLLVDNQLNGIDSIVDKDDLAKVISSRTALKSNTKSVISPFFNMQRKYTQYFSKYFYTFENGISATLAASIKARYKLYSGDRLNNLINTAHNDFMVYLMTRMSALNPKSTSSLAKFSASKALVDVNTLLRHGEGKNISMVNRIFNNLTSISKLANINAVRMYYENRSKMAPILERGMAAAEINLYQNVTPEMARALLDIFKFELGRVVKSDIVKQEDTSIYTQNIPSVDLIMFKDAAVTTVAANTYTEIFEELRKNSPGLIQLFSSISLFQAGLNNSPYNLFKTLPVTDLLSDDRSVSLVSNLSQTIKTFNTLLSKYGTKEERSAVIEHIVEDFLRWFDLQYGKTFVQPLAASKYNNNSRLYKAFNQKDQRYDLYVKNNEEGGGTLLANVNSLTKNYLSTVPYTYSPTTAVTKPITTIDKDNINNYTSQLTSLGALGDVVKDYVEAGGVIEPNCQ